MTQDNPLQEETLHARMSAWMDSEEVLSDAEQKAIRTDPHLCAQWQRWHALSARLKHHHGGACGQIDVSASVMAQIRQVGNVYPLPVAETPRRAAWRPSPRLTAVAASLLAALGAFLLWPLDTDELPPLAQTPGAEPVTVASNGPVLLAPEAYSRANGAVRFVEQLPQRGSAHAYVVEHMYIAPSVQGTLSAPVVLVDGQ